ncbi:MAG: zinc ABC transporter substrate-binding protein [SAR324 cluster bacterium]|nr:zinc ABC transporter substrate-binding protein [SAR324 cluster bacterium]
MADMLRYNMACLLAITALTALLVTDSFAQGTPLVVASIKPVHSLAAAVMGEVARPTLLVTGGSSGHSATLRPSAVRALQRARIVFWIGPALETFLERPLRALPASTRVVAMASLPSVTHLPAEVGGRQEDHQAGHAQTPHAQMDPHIWLDVGNALVMAAAMVRELTALDPVNAPRYRANGRNLAMRLKALDAELRRRMTPLAGRPYLVFHDGYRHFEHRYGLKSVGFLTETPQHRLGARRLKELRARLHLLKVACVFGEPRTSPRLMAAILEGTDARAGTLDPLGAVLPPGRELYFRLMRGMASGLEACLTPAG